MVPLPRIALYGYTMSMTSKVICSVCALGPMLKDSGRTIFPRGRVALPLNSSREFFCWLQLFWVDAHPIEGMEEYDINQATVIHEGLTDFPPRNVAADDHCVGVWGFAKVDIAGIEG